MGVQISPHKKANFEGHPAASCAKVAEPIEMPFGMWTRVCPRKHYIRWGAHRRHLANTIELPMSDG